MDASPWLESEGKVPGAWKQMPNLGYRSSRKLSQTPYKHQQPSTSSRSKFHYEAKTSKLGPEELNQKKKKNLQLKVSISILSSRIKSIAMLLARKCKNIKKESKRIFENKSGKPLKESWVKYSNIGLKSL